MNSDYKFIAKDQLTELAKRNGIKSWNELTDFVKTLPYGRTKNRTDLSLVLSEKKGTCSSKHALLKRLADLNDIPNIELVIGIYKMTESNTPKIGNELTQNGLVYIPEAHCYLKINGNRKDLTSNQSDIDKIAKDIIEEQFIEPHQIAEFKVNYHKNFIKAWLKETDSESEFDRIWTIRENCINRLTE
ncbi:hypothetical protein [Winogradskyella tangerina]|uniref:hypothetical protein n=1 Tax=Winogradskyella tangerina TaxID=2023240 RepID=UPI001E5F2D31|nr:hypothetical protein [Winogradskyella tangerina]